eukprot:3748931-Pyramimonas_sp.AAC.1
MNTSSRSVSAAAAIALRKFVLKPSTNPVSISTAASRLENVVLKDTDSIIVAGEDAGLLLSLLFPETVATVTQITTNTMRTNTPRSTTARLGTRLIRLSAEWKVRANRGVQHSTASPYSESPEFKGSVSSAKFWLISTFDAVLHIGLLNTFRSDILVCAGEVQAGVLKNMI